MNFFLQARVKGDIWGIQLISGVVFTQWCGKKKIYLVKDMLLAHGHSEMLDRSSYSQTTRHAHIVRYRLPSDGCGSLFPNTAKKMHGFIFWSISCHSLTMKILIHAVTACMIQLTVDVPGDLGRVIIFPNSGVDY